MPRFAFAAALTALLSLLATTPSPGTPPATTTGAPADRPFVVATWNILHGGREDGADVGPARVAEVLKGSGADVIALQETYGSGELLAKKTGFHLHARGDNVSILSRFPIVEDLSVDDPFRCVGALIALPDGSRAAVYSIWLPYAIDIWLPGSRAGKTADELAAACAPSAETIDRIERAIRERLSDARYASVPIFLAGDMNAMSHLDYAEANRDQFGIPIAWRTTSILAERGWRDAMREMPGVVDRKATRTWSPRFPEQEQDRIDMIHYRDPRRPAAFRAYATGHMDNLTVDGSPVPFPSDHALVFACFRRLVVDDRARPIRVVTANMRHGRGMDDELNLERFAARLGSLDADIIALQEVDLGVARSNGVNQARSLGSRLGRHAAFGSFMPLGDGYYGCGILSRFPIVATRSIRLPDGNEPRVALEVDVRLPDDSVLTVINVHFDWVDDDAFRFAQAERVAEHIRSRGGTGILLGDFNDGPESRTLTLARSVASEAAKPRDARLTFPASEPTVEIDYIFTWPKDAWTAESTSVVDERLASDHRPVLAVLRRRAEP
jgi:endonuclease/exonuclease/phosphatase family metal-dependent hydrolase